jgi:hypothetical protein
MSPAEAAKLLDLPADATPEQLQARFLELRAKLEDKIAKAPTPGLKEKYRATLVQLTEAFEFLELAGDSSLLPLLAKSESGAGAPSPRPSANVGSPLDGGPGSNPSGLRSQVSGLPPAKRAKSGGKEFLLVAILAAAVLGVGGWWVVKTKAENEEKARIAAELKAENEREAERVRLAAEAARQQEAADRKAEEARQLAERERLDRLTAQLRSRLAETRLAWESLEKEERNTERLAAELKSDLRSATGGAANELRAHLAATQRYLEWLGNHLEKHPARITRAKVEELLAARLPDEAEPLLTELQTALAQLAIEVPARKQSMLSVDGTVAVQSDPANLAFSLVDAFGRSQTGTTPATVNGVAPGKASLTFKRPGFKDVAHEVTVTTGTSVTARGAVISQQIVLKAEADVNFWVNDKFVGRGTVTVKDLPPGNHKLQFARQNTNAFPTTLQVKQEPGTVNLNYSYDAVIREDQSCSPCSGRGNFTNHERCTSCSGRGTVTCMSCSGRGANFLKLYPDQPAIRISCNACSQSGRATCGSCSGNGKFSYTNTCNTCGGDGRVSQLQLALK